MTTTDKENIILDHINKGKNKTMSPLLTMMQLGTLSDIEKNAKFCEVILQCVTSSTTPTEDNCVLVGIDKVIANGHIRTIRQKKLLTSVCDILDEAIASRKYIVASDKLEAVVDGESVSFKKGIQECSNLIFITGGSILIVTKYRLKRRDIHCEDCADVFGGKLLFYLFKGKMKRLTKFNGVRLPLHNWLFNRTADVYAYICYRPQS